MTRDGPNRGQTMVTAERVPEPARGRGVSGPLLGMILFVTSETMFFGALFGSYLTIRFRTVAQGSSWPPEGIHLDMWLPLLLTAVLLGSSVTVHHATQRARAGDLRGLERWLAGTIALGILFLGGQAFEYSQLGFTLGDNAYTTLFFTLTGFHGLHVLIGVVMLLVAVVYARGGRVSARRHGVPEAAAFYWHFVDLVWVALFTMIYVLR